MNNLKQSIIDIIIQGTKLSPDYVTSNLERPPQPELGDYALSCFRLAKESQNPPQEIARKIASEIKPTDIITKIQPVNGYVNIFLNDSKLAELLSEDTISLPSVGRGKTIVIDYSSPNIAKPMGIGHLRSTVIGNALSKIYSALGYKCIGINFLGDWGTQFGMLIAAYKDNPDRFPTSLLMPGNFPADFFARIYAEYNEKARTDSALLDMAKLEFKKLENGDAENRRTWEMFKTCSLSEFRRIYDLLSITFDEYSGEADTNQYLNQTIAEIEKKGLSEISKGALVIKLDKYNMPPCLLRKSDGATLYAARDIAAAIHRYNTYKFHKLIYVVGSDQKLHFSQVFKVLELMSYPWAKDCLHIDFGLVKSKGEKMSTRRGTTILLEEVLEEAISRSKTTMANRATEFADKVAADKIDEVARAVGISAIIFNDLKNKRVKDVDFDWAQILSFDGETGPYLQYTHTRMVSVLEKYYQQNPKSQIPNPKYELLTTPEEIGIIKTIYDFPETVQQSANEYEPSILSNYLLLLSSHFNRYYQYHRIISDDKGLTLARIWLVGLIKETIVSGLTLLGITPLERM
jgi:arginyl-tRNA synthetase